MRSLRPTDTGHDFNGTAATIAALATITQITDSEFQRTRATMRRRDGDSRAAFLIVAANSARQSADADANSLGRKAATLPLPEVRALLHGASDSLAMGRPEAGLRLLARNWPALRENPQIAALAVQWIRRCSTEIGAGSAARILASEHEPDLLRRALELWKEDTSPDHAGIRFLARLARLRSEQDDLLGTPLPPPLLAPTPSRGTDGRSTSAQSAYELPIDLDYHQAPGVSPPR